MMQKIFLAICFLLVGLASPVGAQFSKTESARLATEKMTRGDNAGALAVLDKAIAQRKDLQETYAMRARLRAQTGDLDGAIADFGEAIKITPNDADLYDERAMFRLFKRDSTGALQDYDAAIANGLKTEKVYVGRGMVKRDMGDTEGALLDYRSAIAVNPSFAAAHTGLAYTLDHKGELDAAIVHLQDFLDRYEGKRDGKLPTVQGATSTGVRTSIKRDGEEKDGRQEFLEGGQETMVFKGNTPEEIKKEMARYEQLRNLANAYVTLGKLYAKKNDFDRALENYDKGSRIAKDTPHLNKLRGEARLKRGDLQGAIDDFNAAVNFDTGAPDRHYSKGLLLTLQGRDAEAEQEFARHLQTFPTTKVSLSQMIEAAKKLRAQPKQQ